METDRGQPMIQQGRVRVMSRKSHTVRGCHSTTPPRLTLLILPFGLYFITKNKPGKSQMQVKSHFHYLEEL